MPLCHSSQSVRHPVRRPCVAVSGRLLCTCAVIYYIIRSVGGAAAAAAVKRKRDDDVIRATPVLRFGEKSRSAVAAAGSGWFVPFGHGLPVGPLTARRVSSDRPARQTGRSPRNVVRVRSRRLRFAVVIVYRRGPHSNNANNNNNNDSTMNVHYRSDGKRRVRQVGRHVADTRTDILL